MTLTNLSNLGNLISRNYLPDIILKKFPNSISCSHIDNFPNSR